VAHTKLISEQTPMLCMCPVNLTFDLQNKHLWLNAIPSIKVQFRVYVNEANTVLID